MTHYNEWGEITHNAVLKMGQRELDLVKNYTGHDFDAVLNMYYAKARMYDAENRRFVSVDPILDGTRYDLSEYTTEAINFSAYVYVQDNPIRWIDPLGLFLVGTVLKEGAIGIDVAQIHGYLLAKNYIDVNNPSGVQYTKETTNAVKLFQRDNNLPQTGNVDYATWKAMGFDINNTLEEEFWSGKKGNELISVSIKENTITIDYFPKIFICEERLHTVQGPNYEFSYFYEDSVSEALYKTYEKRIVKGIQQWARNAVNIQGVEANVVVNVTPTKTTLRSKANLIYAIDKDTQNITPETLYWHTDVSPTIILEGIGKNQYYNGKDMVANMASHEFGHVLGIWDAYGYGTHFVGGDIMFPKAPSSIMVPYNRDSSLGKDQISTNSVMNSEWGINYEYEDLLYEMMLYAWKSDQLQIFTPIFGHPDPSQALYR